LGKEVFWFEPRPTHQIHILSLAPKPIPTRNHTGWTSNQLNEVSEMFVHSCASAHLPVLDIGAAYGIATHAALAAGATVIANDVDSAHLKILFENTPLDARARLVQIPGRFPRHLQFAEGSLAAVHASNVFHFLTGPQLENGLASIAHWLAPGGKAFVQASTPWQAPFASFIEEFENLRLTEKFPGWIPDAHQRFDHPKISQIPPAIHLLDDLTLTRLFTDVGLQVERCWLYRRRDLAKGLQFDGRECCGLIARRPS
jgi:SAM-dependent methyltransferase